MGCSKEALRIILWMSWVITWLFNCIFVAITLISFTQLWEASSIYLPTSGQNIYSDRTWRAPMASCILSALLVIGYDIMSCVTLIKKSINRAGPGFGFGFIVAFSFCLAFFLLLCGLVLDSFRPKVKSLSNFDWTFNNTVTNGFVWEKYDSQTFVGAEVFALINFVILLLFAVMLVVLQTGVSEQLGIESTQYAPLETIPMATATGHDAYAGYTADGMEQGQAAQYGYTDDQAGHGAAAGYDHQGGAAMRADNGSGYAYDAQGYQGYAAPGAGVGGVQGATQYGTYGATGASDSYAYDDGTQQQQHPSTAGTGLLGGQAIGSAPAPQGAQTAYAQAGTGAYAYQQF